MALELTGWQWWWWWSWWRWWWLWWCFNYISIMSLIRAVLAAASPSLLGPSLLQEGSEAEDMVSNNFQCWQKGTQDLFWKTLKFCFSKVCLHLPDYSSSSVASVLSLLYYGDHKLRLNLRLLTKITGETWLGIGDSHSRSNINSLLSSLGVALEVWQGPFGPALREVAPRNTLSGFPNQCHK